MQKLGNRFLDILKIFFGCLWGPLSHAAYTERSTIVDLLIKIPGPLNPAAY